MWSRTLTRSPVPGGILHPPPRGRSKETPPPPPPHAHALHRRKIRRRYPHHFIDLTYSNSYWYVDAPGVQIRTTILTIYRGGGGGRCSVSRENKEIYRDMLPREVACPRSHSPSACHTKRVSTCPRGDSADARHVFFFFLLLCETDDPSFLPNEVQHTKLYLVVKSNSYGIYLLKYGIPPHPLPPPPPPHPWAFFPSLFSQECPFH